jgi:hypothetical protein
MTLAPTNETIRHEIMWKKDPVGKRIANMIWECQVWCKDLVRVRVEDLSLKMLKLFLCLIYSSVKGVTHRIESLSNFVLH